MLNSSNRLACRLQRWSSSGQSPTARSHNFTLNTHQHYITTETRAKKSLVHSARGACTHNPATPSKQKVHPLAARFEVRKLLCKLPSKPWRWTHLTSLAISQSPPLLLFLPRSRISSNFSQFCGIPVGGTYQNPQNQCTALKQTKITSKFSNSILRKVPSGHEKNRLHNILRCGRQMMRFRRRRFPCITSSRFCHQLAGPFGHGIHILLNTREFDSPLRTVLTKKP